MRANGLECHSQDRSHNEFVAPAKAGVQGQRLRPLPLLDSRVRGNDENERVRGGC
jgi:hypothetical protein